MEKGPGTFPLDHSAFRPFDPFDKAQGRQAQDGGLGMATAELDMISRPEWMDLKVGCPFW